MWKLSKVKMIKVVRGMILIMVVMLLIIVLFLIFWVIKKVISYKRMEVVIIVG